MPCRSDYADPSGAQLESQRVCTNLKYLYPLIMKDVPPWVKEAAKTAYASTTRLDESTKMLCEACRSLTEAETEQFIYDGRSKKARKLAGWWDRHQEWDKKRVRQEEKARKKQEARQSAIKKLNAKELDALGLVDEGVSDILEQDDRIVCCPAST